MFQNILFQSFLKFTRRIIKSAIHVLELVSALFVVGAGFKVSKFGFKCRSNHLQPNISLNQLYCNLDQCNVYFQEAWTGHWSVLNSVVLAVHCYFNVWIRIKNGWRSFLLRQVTNCKSTKMITIMSSQKSSNQIFKWFRHSSFILRLQLPVFKH